MLNAITVIELGDRDDQEVGYGDGAALVGVVDEMRFGFWAGTVVRTNVITINLDALDEGDYGTALTLHDAKALLAALGEAVAFVERHGQTINIERNGDTLGEAAHG